jgi:hypothetical protein
LTWSLRGFASYHLAELFSLPWSLRCRRIIDTFGYRERPRQ